MNTKNVPLNVIAENLSKVLKDTAQHSITAKTNNIFACAVGAALCRLSHDRRT